MKRVMHKEDSFVTVIFFVLIMILKEFIFYYMHKAIHLLMKVKVHLGTSIMNLPSQNFVWSNLYGNIMHE